MIKNSIIVILVLVLVYESTFFLQHIRDRVRYYDMAKHRSHHTGRPLMIIGSPDAGWFNSVSRSYGCGDVVLDLNTASGCNSDPGDVHETILKYSDNSHVIFISYTLEYISNLELLIPQLYRVAGGPENIFVMHASQYSLWLRFPYSSGINDPPPQNAIISAPPNTTYIEFKKL